LLGSRLPLVCAACIGLSCCGQQPIQPSDKTAVIASGQWGKVYRGGYVELASVNGQDPHWRLRSDAEVQPGNIALVAYVYLCQQGVSHCTSIAGMPLTVAAQPGHRYRLHAVEQVSGSNRFWVWATDEKDASLAGGTPPARP
jgi:hypothetical protein